MDVANPHERTDVGLMGLGRQGIPKENDGIHLSGRHPGPDLLVAAERA